MAKQTHTSNTSSSSKDVSKVREPWFSADNIPAPDVSLFGRRKYVSIRGLAAVLDEIKQYGMPDVTSFSGIKRARDTEFAALSKTSYGEVITHKYIGVDENDKPLEFWFADPRATLYHFIRDCSKLESFFLECFDLF